ncbi:MAG: class I SAM-dependent methyltransferase [bacterium]
MYKNRKPKRILEIGTFKGETLFCFTKLADSDAVIISIDLLFGKSLGTDMSKTISNPKSDIYIIKVFEHFVSDNQKLNLLRQSSYREDTVQKVKEILGNDKLDFIFIDADHSYDGVKKDFELYSQFISEGGIIAFHDISEYIEKTVNNLSIHGVNKFWNELKNSKQKYNFKEYEEIFENAYTYGIGVVYF